MPKRTHSIMRTLAAFSSAGLLLQAGGCSVDLSSVGQSLVTSTVNSLLTSYVFGLFNIPLGGF